MARIRVFDFQENHKGLWVLGPRDRTPKDALRRARGLNSIPSKELRSRNGSTVEDTIAAVHSLTRFDDVRFQGATTVLYRNAVSTITGLDGTPLALVVSEPRSNTDAEYLFVAGGGLLRKVDTAGAVTNWGIVAPTEGEMGSSAGSAASAQAKQVAPLDDTSEVSLAISRLSASTTNPTLSANTSNKQEGSASLQVSTETIVAASNPVHPALNLTLSGTVSAIDLTVFPSADESTDADFIQFWLFLSDEAFAALMLLRLNMITTSSNGFGYVFYPTSEDPGNGETTDKITTGGQWIHLSIAKSEFFQFGSSADWSSITGFSFTLYFSGPVSVNLSDPFFLLDNLALDGGGVAGSGNAGNISGDYKYRFTYKNSVTGNRSNAGAVTIDISDIDRGGGSLTGLPVSGDAQVDSREIWRTLNGGVRYFLLDTIADNTTTTYSDDTGDSDLATTELPTDNDPPDADFDDVIFDRVTAFWITLITGKQGRVYYSPVGRPESKKGFIDVGTTGDPLFRLIMWNGLRFAVSESKFYRVDGDDPYTARQAFGVPGVQFAQRFTIVSTPFGVIWQAADGIRIFNGATSILLFAEPIISLFRGEAAENLTAFEGTNATYARGEYIISDGSQCLALNLETRTWRDLGYTDITALYYEWDTDTIVAGRTSNTQLIEVEGAVTDAGTGIPIAWESPAIDTPLDQVFILEDVYIELDASGETVTPTLVHKAGTLALTNLTPASRATSTQELNRMFQLPGLRLTATASDQIILYSAEFEVHTLEMVIHVNGRQIKVPARTDSLSTAIYFDIDPELVDLNQTDSLFIIDRVLVEIDSNSNSITPSLLLGSTTVNLSAISNSARAILEEEVDRVGPLNRVTLTGDFTQDVQLFRVEIVVRPLEMGLNLPGGQRIPLPGRSVVPGTAVIFEVPPTLQEFDQADNLFVVDRLTLELDSNSNNVTPTLVLGTTSVALAAANNSARVTVEYEVDRLGPLNQLTLAGDFTADIQLFRVEVHLRPLNLGIVRTDNGQRIPIPGRAPVPGTEIEFEVPPELRAFDELGSSYIIERIAVEANTNSNAITPVIDIIGASITKTAVNTASRLISDEDVQRVGPVLGVRLTGDFTNDVQMFGVELFIRPVNLGVRFPNGERISIDGRFEDAATSIIFDVDPDSRLIDAQSFVPFIERLVLDINTTDGIDITPVILLEDGQSISLSAASGDGRDVYFYDVERLGRVTGVRLDGDFITNAVELYGLELFIRPLELGITIQALERVGNSQGLFGNPTSP